MTEVRIFAMLISQLDVSKTNDVTLLVEGRERVHDASSFWTAKCGK